MSEMNEYTPDLYELIDDDGNKSSFELLDAMEIDGEQYFALTPYFENENDMLQDDGEVVILKSFIDETGEEIMISIDDEEEFNRVGEIFMERLNDMYEFEEDDCDCHDEDCDCCHHE